MEDKSESITEKIKGRIHPKEKSHFLSHIFFCWEIPLFIKAFKTELNESSLYPPLKEYEAKKLGDKLEKYWQDEENFRENPSLWRAIIRMFWLEFVAAFFVFFPVDVISSVLQPWCLKKLLDFYTPNQTEVTRNEAFMYASVVTSLSLVLMILRHTYLLSLSVLGIKVRVACCSLIYRKCLKLKKNDFESTTAGQIVNLMSNDVRRFDTAFIFLHFIWAMPLEHVLCACYLYFTLGYTSLIGFVTILIYLLLQIYVYKATGAQRLQVANKSDFRIRLMNDIISGIQVIKMYTWEKPFINLVKAIRRSELQFVKKANFIRLANNICTMYIAKLSIISSVVIADLTKVSLTAQYVHVLTSVYEKIKYSSVIYTPLALMMISEANIAVRRIENFLLTNKSKKICSRKMKRSNKIANICTLNSNSVAEKQQMGLFIKNVYAKWKKSSNEDVLSNISFTALPGETVAVIGASGSGKSAFLLAVLEEIEIVKGNLHVGGTVSYAPQEPWIFSASIRQNILFGQQMDEERYFQVVKVCALEFDFSLLPHRDLTLVGERGVMLSGGQKARINLARAVYRNANIYLLDDPLSAVDAHVAKSIFKECIKNYLQQKCVVLTTHQVQHLENVDRVYIVEEGKMSTKVQYEETFLKKFSSKDNTKGSSAIEKLALFKNENLQKETKEHRSIGLTGWHVYKNYVLYSGKSWLFCIILCFFFMIQLLCSVIDYTLTYCVNMSQKPTESASINFVATNFTYINVAFMISLILIFILVTNIGVIYFKHSSKKMHNKMLTVIMRTALSFFHHHPSGRILNRFSKDIGAIDEYIPYLMFELLKMLCYMTGAVILMLILNYWLLIPAIILLTILYLYDRFFQPANQNMKRTDGTTRSLVFSHLNASLRGLKVIRAFRNEDILKNEFDNFLNLNSTASYLCSAFFYTLGFWVDIACALYSGIVIYSFFFYNSEVYTGNVGLAITQSFNLLILVQYYFKVWAQLDSLMTSVERVLEYSHLSPEMDDGKEIPSETWPSEGAVNFMSVSMRYFPETPLALDNVTFHVKSGEKVGVVGRTGAGKTSLTSALFRLFDYEGTIFIDGVDIKTVPLNTLRSKISIVPQDPVLFLGTLRKNLDPFDEFTDEQIWNALEELDLKTIISGLASGLDFLVSESGSNFSVGQRQLLCLARSLLRSTKIIVLDEATANVDLKTDELIQSTIRTKFKHCTLLTIAHRLNTVMDSDKILVMDNGRVVEYDSPSRLLENRNGMFYNNYVSQTSKLNK